MIMYFSSVVLRGPYLVLGFKPELVANKASSLLPTTLSLCVPECLILVKIANHFKRLGQAQC